MTFLKEDLPLPISVHDSLPQQADTTIHASCAAYCVLLFLVKIQRVAGQQPEYGPHMTVSAFMNFCFAGAMAMRVHVRTAGMLQAQGTMCLSPQGAMALFNCITTSRGVPCIHTKCTFVLHYTLHIAYLSSPVSRAAFKCSPKPFKTSSNTSCCSCVLLCILRLQQNFAAICL